jgi:hypothetical protein
MMTLNNDDFHASYESGCGLEGEYEALRILDEDSGGPMGFRKTTAASCIERQAAQTEWRNSWLGTTGYEIVQETIHSSDPT